MASTMNAAVVRDLGKPLAIEEVPVPQPNENQILVGIAATGVCHTDLHAAKGDCVRFPWLHTVCGCCSICRTGWDTLCAPQLNSGYSVNGSFAKYARADPADVGRLPKSVECGPVAPTLCAGVTVYKGVKEAEGRPHEWAVISGIAGRDLAFSRRGRLAGLCDRTSG